MLQKNLLYILMMILVAIMYVTLPKSWKKERWQRILFAGYGVCAICSFNVMVSLALFSHNVYVRTIFTYSTLIFFLLTCSFIGLFMVRYLLLYILIRLKAWTLVKQVLRPGVLVAGVLVCTLFFLIFGSMHYNDCKITTYAVDFTEGKTQNASAERIALIADVHLGAGSDQNMIDEMYEKLKDQNLSYICIVGDLIDMTCYETDIEYFARTVSRIPTKQGIFFAEGNHEKDSNIDYIPILEKYGITCLYDEALLTDTGIALVGRKDDLAVPVSAILKKSGISETTPTVVLSHEPKQFMEMCDQNCLVLSGHTHGFQLPFWGYVDPFLNDLCYGYKEFGNLKAITTSGLSAWGFRISWPSYNEICIIDVTV